MTFSMIDRAGPALMLVLGLFTAFATAGLGLA
jgi:hypothetical protein